HLSEPADAYYFYRAARRLIFSELYRTKYGETTRLSFAQIKHTANEITNPDEADRTPLVDVVACAGGDWSVVRWRAGAGGGAKPRLFRPDRRKRFQAPALRRAEP